MIVRTNRGKLALAIYKRDFDAAIKLLTLMAATNEKWAVAVQVARTTVKPLAPLPDTEPFVVPMPGHALHSTLAKPVLKDQANG